MNGMPLRYLTALPVCMIRRMTRFKRRARRRARFRAVRAAHRASARAQSRPASRARSHRGRPAGLVDELKRRRQQTRRHVVRRKDVEQAGLREFECGDVARVRAAPHDVGRAHDRRDAVLARGLRGDTGGWEFGQRDAFGGRLFDVLDHRIVMARHRNAEFDATRHDVSAVLVGVALLAVSQLGHHGGEAFVGQLAMAFLPAAPLIGIVPACDP
jgi:hypothetical protein